MRTFLEVIKDLELIDVHVPAAGSDEQKPRARKKPVPKPAATEVDVDVDKEWSIPMEIAKLDADQCLVFGWASVVEKDGALIIDKQGDTIEPAEIEKAAYDFVLNSRQQGDMHRNIGVGRLVESVVFTTEKQAALGINLGKVGWWVGFKVDDGAVWKSLKSGERPEFSIGGRAMHHEDASDGA